MAALTTLNITEKNANNSLSVTVKVNVTKEGVFTTTLSKEDMDKIHSYGIKLPTNRLGNEGYFNSIALSDLESQIREVLKRCLSYKIVEEVPVIKYQLETNCMFSYDKNGNIVPNPSKEWTGNDENGKWRDGTSRLDALNTQPFGFSVYAKPFLKTEVANLLVKYNAFKTESRYMAGSYEQFWIMKEGVCPAVKGETGYSKEEFDKIDEKNKNPELTSINTFNDTVKKANEIKDRVLKYVYNIKQERSYNNDLVGIFERYKDIADGDMEVAMNFIKEAYPFNEETESFIRKKFDMPIPDESKEQ